MCWRVILSIIDISSFASKSARIRWIDRQMYGSSERLQGLVLIRFASPRCCPLCPSSSTWLPRRFFFLSSKRKVKTNPARDCKRNPEKCAEMQRIAEMRRVALTSYDFLWLPWLVSSCFILFHLVSRSGFRTVDVVGLVGSCSWSLSSQDACHLCRREVPGSSDVGHLHGQIPPVLCLKRMVASVTRSQLSRIQNQSHYKTYQQIRQNKGSTWLIIQEAPRTTCDPSGRTWARRGSFWCAFFMVQSVYHYLPLVSAYGYEAQTSVGLKV